MSSSAKLSYFHVKPSESYLRWKWWKAQTSRQKTNGSTTAWWVKECKGVKLKDEPLISTFDLIHQDGFWRAHSICIVKYEYGRFPKSGICWLRLCSSLYFWSQISDLVWMLMATYLKRQHTHTHILLLFHLNITSLSQLLLHHPLSPSLTVGSGLPIPWPSGIPSWR